MEWKTFHDYNRLVRRGMAAPLLCPNDESLLFTTFGKNDEPALRCFVCETVFEPGLALYDRIKAVVNEHYN